MLDMDERLRALEKEAVQFANVLRKIDGAPHARSLAHGVRRDCAGCPVAATAGEGWEVGPGGAIKVGPRGGQKGPPVPVPESVLDFIAAFDAGMYPQLILALTHTEISLEPVLA